MIINKECKNLKLCNGGTGNTLYYLYDEVKKGEYYYEPNFTNYTNEDLIIELDYPIKFIGSITITGNLKSNVGIYANNIDVGIFENNLKNIECETFIECKNIECKNLKVGNIKCETIQCENIEKTGNIISNYFIKVKNNIDAYEIKSFEYIEANEIKCNSIIANSIITKKINCKNIIEI